MSERKRSAEKDRKGFREKGKKRGNYISTRGDKEN